MILVSRAIPMNVCEFSKLKCFSREISSEGNCTYFVHDVLVWTFLSHFIPLLHTLKVTELGNL